MRFFPKSRLISTRVPSRRAVIPAKDCYVNRHKYLLHLTNFRPFSQSFVYSPAVVFCLFLSKLLIRSPHKHAGENCFNTQKIHIKMLFASQQSIHIFPLMLIKFAYLRASWRLDFSILCRNMITN